ncbi:ABC transporter permease [Bosea vestrisii]|uniref:ABC transporter permease n=1 Tax=Bosea vestrisii TaxID=151416 RepID=UPI0024DFF51B|nr:ABC transporter permease [Bosea vestrisii]WID98559.1 ABC transporter permease [Bosea vestrisii]
MTDQTITSRPSVARRVAKPARGIWRQGWQRFTKSRTGMLGLILVMFVVATAVLGPFLAPFDPQDQSPMIDPGSKAPPSWTHPLGTDRMGYDVLSRLIYGAPTALAVGLGAMSIASLIGVLVGGFAGYRGGTTDEVLMRFTDFFLVIPVFVVILAVVRLLGVAVVNTPFESIPYLNLSVIILLIGVFSWAPIARMTRAEFLRLKNQEFVEAARCIGATSGDILFRHILPNALPSLVVIIALGIGGAVLSEAMIGFLGFGDPAAVSWGQLLYFNYEALKVAPWASLSPGAAIFVTVLGFNLLADGLTDAFNPRAKS